MKKNNTLIAAFAALALTCATAQAGHHHGPPHRDLYTVLDIISVVNDVCRTAAIVNASTKPVEVRTTSTYVPPTYVQPVQPTYVQPTTTYVQPMTPFGPTTVIPMTTYVQPGTVVQPGVTAPTVVQPVVTAPTVVQPVVTRPTVIYGSGYYYPSTHWYNGSHYHHPAPAPVHHGPGFRPAPAPHHPGFRPAPAPHHPGFRPGPGLPPPRH